MATKLCVSPKKYKKNVSKCIIHNDRYSEKEKLRGFTEKSSDKLRKASATRKDHFITSLLRDNDEVQKAQFHQKCYDLYTHPKSLKQYETESETENDDEGDGLSVLSGKRKSDRKRNRMGKLIADIECCICYGLKRQSGGNTTADLQKCITATAAVSLQKSALMKGGNDRLSADVAGISWKNIVAKELHYHRSCYRSFTRPTPKNIQNDRVDQAAMEKVFVFLQEKVINEKEIVLLKTITDMYNDHNKNTIVPDNRTFICIIKDKFEDEIGAWSDKGQPSFLFNESVPKGEIISILSNKIKKLSTRQDEAETMIKVAKHLREELKCISPTYECWPPTETDTHTKTTAIPPLLSSFLQCLLSGKKSLSERKKRQILSIGQDIIYAVSNGKHKTSKHVLLSLCSKRLTGSKIIIRWLNRLGHSLSYDETLVLETSLAEDEMRNRSLPHYCPSSIQPSTFVTFVWDNNDINPETLTGVSMHCTNGIVIQLVNDQPQHQPLVRDRPFIRRRSFKAVPHELNPYINKKRVNPNHLTTMNTCEGNVGNIKTSASRLFDFLWTLLSLKGQQQEQLIPNWTGFNSRIDPKAETNHTITYLPAINNTPTKLNTVLELLVQSKVKAEHLGLTDTDVVLDQAIFAKAVEIVLNPSYIALKRFIVLRLGAFHTSCIFLSVIGKRFADAGLRDWIIEAGLLGTASVEQLLNGNHYNNGVRVLKYLYNALMRCRLELFADWLGQKGCKLESITESVEFQNCLLELNEESFSKVINNHFPTLELADEHFQQLKNVESSGPTAVFWSSFIDMMNILFAFIRATKIGDWDLHMSATKKMLPWMFAYDRPNYSRYLTYYWYEMQQLPETHPGIYEQFKNGNFSVRRTPGSFNKIPSDQAIEQTINREQKGHGGITGYSTTPGTIQRWVLTSHVLSKCVARLRQDLDLDLDFRSRSKDLGFSRMKFDTKSVEESYEVLVSWGNPFQYRASLINISSGTEINCQKVKNDILDAEKKGTSAFNDFVRDRIRSTAVLFYDRIKKLKLKTFKNQHVKKLVNIKSKSISIAAERSIFGRLLLVARNRETLPLETVLSYSLSPIPWSLGLPDGGLVKTQKSKLLDVIEKDFGHAQRERPTSPVMIFDGMVILQQLGSIPLETFGDLSEFVLKRITNNASDLIYFCVDLYPAESIKGYERSRRAQSGTLRVHLERRDQKVPKQLSKYMASSDNKVELVKFLHDDWSDSTRYCELIKGKTLLVNVGHQFFYIRMNEHSKISSESSDLSTDQEEADTKVFLCAKHAQEHGEENVCIVTVDSDIAIYALYFHWVLQVNIFVQIGSGNRLRVLSIPDIASELGLLCCQSLPGLHAFTGNDYTSAFYGNGKIKAFRIMKSSEEYIEIFKKFGDSFVFDATAFQTVEKFVCALYGQKCSDVNEARFLKFSSKAKTPEPQQLPPTKDALLCHCKRVNYVTAIVKQSLEDFPQIPSPDGYGWIVENNSLQIQWMLLPPAPPGLVDLISCNCRRGCDRNTCICMQHRLKCTENCNCGDCPNMLESDVESDDSDDDDSIEASDYESDSDD